MSKKKAGKKGGQATRVQQQQQAAAKRHIAASATRQNGPATTEQADEPQAPRPQRGKTRLFLDVSAVRIQECLARTPDLKFRRGASALLTEATPRKSWEASPPGGMCWKGQAGDVAGVVTLYADDIAGTDQEGSCAAAVQVVAARMRELMPHCH